MHVIMRLKGLIAARVSPKYGMAPVGPAAPGAPVRMRMSDDSICFTQVPQEIQDAIMGIDSGESESESLKSAG
ncbi:hypothetical protein EDD98_3645 [Streptomyces sp. PanSC19]|nr:hypothetical protein EDD98_3645 [Streptomyces sp. PanSC19]